MKGFFLKCFSFSIIFCKAKKAIHKGVEFVFPTPTSVAHGTICATEDELLWHIWSYAPQNVGQSIVNEILW